MKFEKMIDHTYLKPEGTSKEIDKLIEEAIEWQFGGICINSSWIKHARDKIGKSDIKIISVIGFPLGAGATQAKVQEAKLAIDDGQYDYVLNEIKKIKEVIGNKILKVIIETALLKDYEIEKAAEIVLHSGADYIKTSTGFSYRGATFNDIEIFNKVIKGKIKMKAAGGIKTINDLEKYAELGVERFGTSSSIAILSGKTSKEKY